MLQKNLYMVAGVAVLVLVMGIAYASYSHRTESTNASVSAQQVNYAIVQTQTAASTSVPTTSNPVKAATPAVNPIDATNPFNGTSSSSAAGSGGYQNPF